MKTYTAKNLDEALKAAAEDKNVMISDLTYTVVEESNGFLGIGSKTTISAYCKKDICVFMKEYLQKYFNGIGMQADVEVSEQNDFYKVTLDAENNAILIGKTDRHYSRSIMYCVLLHLVNLNVVYEY